jgi:glutamate dehydrogenase
VCTSLATRIIYREGLDYFRDVPDAKVAELALAYIVRERRTAQLIAEVSASGLGSAAEIARILRVGGTRAGLKASVESGA